MRLCARRVARLSWIEGFTGRMGSMGPCPALAALRVPKVEQNGPDVFVPLDRLQQVRAADVEGAVAQLMLENGRQSVEGGHVLGARGQDRAV